MFSLLKSIYTLASDQAILDISVEGMWDYPTDKDRIVWPARGDILIS